MSAVDQGKAIRNGEIGSCEIVRHYLNRIDRLNGELAAFLTVTPELAIAEAKMADERVRNGVTASAVDGVPFAVKDLNAVAGTRTTYGSVAFENNVAERDDRVVVKMRASGAVNLGKTNVCEFGLSCYTESNLALPARVPAHQHIGAGGSSGGAAVAVASGMLPFAQGSDGGGSIRIPASINGLVGLKTSRGFIAKDASAEDPAVLACTGPIARTVADAAAFLDACSGERDRYFDASRTIPARLRIGRYADNMYGVAVDPECIRVWDEVSVWLEKLGHEVVDIQCPASNDVAESYLAAWFIGAAAIDVPPDKEHLLTPLTRMLRERGCEYSPDQKLSVLSYLKHSAMSALETFNQFDAVLTPTLAQLPLLVGAIRNDADPQRDLAAQCEFTPFTSLYNITGQPAISLPAGNSEQGLCIGVQIAARVNCEAELISLSAQLEDAI